MRQTTASLIEIVGVNGQHWTVSGDGMGEQGVELDRDPDGLFDAAPFTSLWQQGSTQEGATYLGTTIEPLDMVLEFHVSSDPKHGRDWDAVEADFFASFDPKRHATIKVTSEMGTRTIKVVSLERIERISAIDPRILGYCKVRLTLRAPWPFWEGITRLATVTAPTANHYTDITVWNPTDRPMWLKWTMTAPGRWVVPDFSFADDEHAHRRVTTPTLRAGQDLTIDTYPRHERYVAADGSNIAGRFGGVDFLYPVPPRTAPTQVPVEVIGGVAGQSTIQCRMVEMWQRAEGGSGSW